MYIKPNCVKGLLEFVDDTTKFACLSVDVTIDDMMYATRLRCAGGLKKFDLSLGFHAINI